ncbi:IS3 family transposase [Streptomyces sp. YGL11-2]|uniref:IS3 family transposase n=1 Tax=Streptomyces sp. YGL11-2 TaxID=3414028 RepID=UPI003CE90E63
MRQAADEALAHEITVIHVASRQTYGVPRVHAELRRLGLEPQTHRQHHARAGHTRSQSPQTALADRAGQEGPVGPGPDRPRLARRPARNQAGRRHHRPAHR